MTTKPTIRRALGMIKPKRGREPTIKTAERKRAKARRRAGPTTAEDARAAGYPVPAQVLHGVALYACPVYDARITVQHCDFNRRVARQAKAAGADLGQPVTAGGEFKQGTSTSLYQDEIDCRRSSCGKCPGVLTLAKAPDLAPASIRVAPFTPHVAQRHTGIVEAMGDWSEQ